ncbi:MAG: LptF/LptG family permease [Treponema sp.]|nr:LptF/LptG family permease [Treponema sp.]
MTLVKYIFKQFIPVFFGALILAALVLNLVDVLMNLWRYIQHQVPARTVFKIMALYAPKTFWYAIPLAILFAVAYTLSSLYAKNELTAVFVSGVSLFKFTLPLLIFSFCTSIALFFLDEKLAVETYAKKKELQNKVLNKTDSDNKEASVVIADDGKIIYRASSYDDDAKQLHNVYFIFRNQNKILEAVVYSAVAKWNESENIWVLTTPMQYTFKNDNTVYEAANHSLLERLTENASTFKNSIIQVEEVTAKIAREYIKNRIRVGLPYNEALSLYYKKFSFPFIVFIVVFLSIGLAGRTRKNVMLTSTALSIGAATLFYVTQMVTMLLAKFGYVSAFIGAWFPVLLFVVISVFLLRSTRT